MLCLIIANCRGQNPSSSLTCLLAHLHWQPDKAPGPPDGSSCVYLLSPLFIEPDLAVCSLTFLVTVCVSHSLSSSLLPSKIQCWTLKLGSSISLGLVTTDNLAMSSHVCPSCWLLPCAVWGSLWPGFLGSKAVCI